MEQRHDDWRRVMIEALGRPGIPPPEIYFSKGHPFLSDVGENEIRVQIFISTGWPKPFSVFSLSFIKKMDKIPSISPQVLIATCRFNCLGEFEMARDAINDSLRSVERLELTVQEMLDEVLPEPVTVP